jgi:FKBP-type peptidyl-prolyl cis-trans isomerase (trigger factor)
MSVTPGCGLTFAQNHARADFGKAAVFTSKFKDPERVLPALDDDRQDVGTFRLDELKQDIKGKLERS